MLNPSQQQMSSPLAQPLLAAIDEAGHNSGSSDNSSFSPLPPSASKSRLTVSPLSQPRQSESSAACGGHTIRGRHEVSTHTSGPGHPDAAHQEKPPAQKPVPLTSWPFALSHALPILMMNLAQALAQAQLVCLGTSLGAPGVAAMNMLGLVVAQLFFLGLSRVSRYAIATPDVTFGLLCHAAITSVYISTPDVVEAAKIQTALAALAVCTLLQASCYLVLGRLRASELVQYVPYPVVCGVLGVTGLGICCGALGIAGFDVGFVHNGWPFNDGSPDFAGAPADFYRELQQRPAQFAATVLFATTSLGIASQSNAATAFLLCVPASLLLFYGGVVFTEATEAGLVTAGWLFPRSGHNHPLVDMWHARNLASVHWRVAMPDTIGTALRMLISLTALVLKVIAVEAAAGVPVDVDAELRTAGLANMAGAFVAGSDQTRCCSPF